MIKFPVFRSILSNTQKFRSNHVFRTFQIRQISQNYDARRIPRCLYMQNPIRWLQCKCKFQFIKMKWDEQFIEKEFKTGTRQAVFLILNLLKRTDIVSMRKLTTSKGFNQLSRDAIASKDDDRLNLLSFRPQDITHTVPVNIQLIDENEHRHCFVDVFFIGMRYLDDIIDNQGQHHQDSIKALQSLRKLEQQSLLELDGHDKIIFAEMFARFYCNFTKQENQTIIEEHSKGWHVDFFKVVDFDMLYYK